MTMKLNIRLKTARNHANLTQIELSEKSDVAQQTISAIETGKASESPGLIKLAIACGVRPEWLENEDGEMLAESSAKSVGMSVVAWEHTSDLSSDEYVFVKRYDLHLAAGNGHVVYDELEKATPQSFRIEWLNSRGFNPSDLVCLYAKGDSMEPAIKDKASVTINLSKKSITDGEAYALRSGSEIMVKYLYKRPDGGILIHSENGSRYPDLVVEYKDMEHIEVIGQVVNVSSDW